MDQKPSIGRIVLYRPDGDVEFRPAVITKVWNETLVDLQVFGAELLEPQGNLPTSVIKGDSQGITPRAWSWPPRV